MANCDSGNQTLDPFQTVLGALDTKVKSLENQSRRILPFVTSFRQQGNSFDENNISDSNVVDAALADFTKEAMCASQTDLQPINDFAEDCLNEALRGVRRYLKDILGNVEDGIDLIQSLSNLPENALMKLLQKVWRLCNDIGSLISALDIKITCITSKDDLGDYTDQVDDIQSRINTVTDDLYLDADGSFNQNKLMTGFNSSLAANLNAYKSRSDSLQSEIQDDIDATLNIPSTVNPRNRF